MEEKKNAAECGVGSSKCFPNWRRKKSIRLLMKVICFGCRSSAVYLQRKRKMDSKEQLWNHQALFSRLHGSSLEKRSKKNNFFGIINHQARPPPYGCFLESCKKTQSGTVLYRTWTMVGFTALILPHFQFGLSTLGFDSAPRTQQWSKKSVT